jgi:hypothetical protein
VAFGLTVGLGFGLGVVVEPWVFILWVTGGAVGFGFGVGLHPVGHRWSRESWVWRGSSSRGSPVCRRFEVGLGFWSRRGGGAVGLGFGVGSSSRGSPVCRGFEVDLGFWISTRWWAVGLPWVFGFVCRGSWESTTKKKKKIKMRREKREMRRDKNKVKIK